MVRSRTAPWRRLKRVDDRPGSHAPGANHSEAGQGCSSRQWWKSVGSCRVPTWFETFHLGASSHGIVTTVRACVCTGNADADTTLRVRLPRPFVAVPVIGRADPAARRGGFRRRWRRYIQPASASRGRPITHQQFTTTASLGLLGRSTLAGRHSEGPLPAATIRIGLTVSARDHTSLTSLAGRHQDQLGRFPACGLLRRRGHCHYQLEA